MRTSAPVSVILHSPQTAQGRQELARRLGEVQADFAASTIGSLHCPLQQKLELLQAVIDTARGGRTL